MGSISGSPKAPAQQVVYVPQYVYETPTSSGSTTTEATSTPEQQREQSLLSRSRSRIGTILTGFRGILSPADTQGQKKTLLGE